MTKPITKRVETDCIITEIGRHYFCSYFHQEDSDYQERPVLIWWVHDEEEMLTTGRNEAGYSSALIIKRNREIGLMPSGNGYYVPGRHD